MVTVLAQLGVQGRSGMDEPAARTRPRLFASFVEPARRHEDADNLVPAPLVVNEVVRPKLL